MLTPVFHPNIAPHAICIGDHWNAGEPLWSMVARIGEMIAYQSYNTKSPLNGEAARWVESNQDKLPLDKTNFMFGRRAAANRTTQRRAAECRTAAPPCSAIPMAIPLPPRRSPLPVAKLVGVSTGIAPSLNGSGVGATKGNNTAGTTGRRRSSRGAEYRHPVRAMRLAFIRPARRGGEEGAMQEMSAILLIPAGPVPAIILAPTVSVG